MPEFSPLNEAFHFQEWTIRHNGRTKAVDDTSKPVVFVHGTPWSSNVFHPLAQALKSTGRYKPILYDLPGYGFSQELDETVSGHEDANFDGDTSVKFQAMALAALLKHLGLDRSEKPAVIAHDIAGTIVLRAHLIHGCEFSSLLLTDTNAVLPWGDGFYKTVRSEPDAFLQLPSSIFDAMVRGVIRSACCDTQFLAPGWENALARPWVANKRDAPSFPSAEDKQRSFVRQIAQANDNDVAEMLDQNLYSQV